MNKLDKKSRPALGPTGRNERWRLFSRLGSQVRLEMSLRMCGALTPNPHTLTRLSRPKLYPWVSPHRSKNTGCWLQHPDWDVWHPGLMSASEALQLWSFQEASCFSYTQLSNNSELESCSLGCQTDSHSHSNQRTILKGICTSKRICLFICKNRWHYRITCTAVACGKASSLF